MQEETAFTEMGSPPRFTFPELHSCCTSELSSSTSTPFVSAPSSPSRMKGFCFSASASAPTSPSTWAQTALLLPPPSEAQDLLHPLNFPQFWSQHTHNPGDATTQIKDSRISIWSHHTPPLHLKGDDDLRRPHIPLHVLPDTISPSLHRTSASSPPSLQAAHHRISSSSQQTLPTEYDRSSNWAQQSLPTEHHSTSAWSQKAFQEEHVSSSQASLHIKDSHSAQSNWTQKTQSIITNFANHKALKRPQAEDLDASYSRKSFYASAIPFSWEEKPGTPKARSVTSEASNGEEDSSSVLLSGSSEFEFSARFSELEEPPMSPTPISSTFSSFKHRIAYDHSPSPTHKLAHANPGEKQSEPVNEEQIWPLRPPPRLDNPVLPLKQLITDESSELKHSYGSLTSLSMPQSPRSPRIFDLRGAFCGIFNPADAVFDPFVTAMEKSMAKNNDDLANEEMGKGFKKITPGHHRRTQSSSPLRIFHWDDHSAKSNSSSNGSVCMDEIKNKHPVQREINARHSFRAPKSSKRWSFKGFLHRKSVSGAESARHSNMSVSLRSSGRESCGSPVTGQVPMDVSYVDDNIKMRGGNMDDKMKGRGANSPVTNNSSMLSSIPSSPSSILSSSSSSNSSRGKLSAQKSNKGPYALHYGMQRAHTEDLSKKTFLPYKQGLLGCLGLSSKSYRALATVSKPLQSVS